MIDKIVNEIDNYEKVLILGFGREGKSTYNLIRRYLPDKKLIIADSSESVLENNEELKSDGNLSLVLGNKYLDNLDSYDLIIKSPGVNFKYVNYESFKDKITSQIDLFLRYKTCLTIGVTGTKGKSTTSSLVYHILNGLGKDAFLAGNIGVPVFDKLDGITENAIFVIELSCHQLQFVKSSPDISILLNVYEEHLDLYKTYEEYVLAKLNIFKYQKENDYKIWGLDSPESGRRFNNALNTYTFSKESNKVKTGIVLKDDGLYLVKDNKEELVYDKLRKRNLLGDHNLYNVAAALCVSDILNMDLNQVSNLIDDFKPLEHRMELVGTFKNITFYNDSIATIPEATINCVNAIGNVDTVIIGGMDRKIDLNILIDFLNKDNGISNYLFLKDTGYKIYDELKSLGCSKNMFKVSDMKEAVIFSYKYTKEGCSCVLSPAAASYNTYKNFEERGKDYKKWVKELS